jgi:hypothetical protein
MFKIVQNLLFLPYQKQILIRSLLRYRIHTDMCYWVETFVVSWAIRAKQLLVLHSVTNYCGTNLIFFMILMISSWISGELYFSLLLLLQCSYMFDKYWVTMCLWIHNYHKITWLQNMTAYIAILCFLNFQQYMLVFHYLGLFKFWEFINYWYIYRIFGCDRKENKDIMWYNSYINSYISALHKSVQNFT